MVPDGVCRDQHSCPNATESANDRVEAMQDPFVSTYTIELIILPAIEYINAGSAVKAAPAAVTAALRKDLVMAQPKFTPNMRSLKSARSPIALRRGERAY